MTTAPTPSDADEPRYSDVVHHANVKSSLSYVARKTGLGYVETTRLLELALQRGDLANGDYAGRRLSNYVDDETKALRKRITELQADNERLQAELEARKPLSPDALADKCEAWLQEHVGTNIVDAFEAGYRTAEAAHGIKGDDL